MEEVIDGFCTGDSYSFFGLSLNQEGIYYHNLKDIMTCDSVVVRLELSKLDSINILLIEEHCDSYTWNGMTYSQSGVHSFTNQTTEGCDSLVTLDLTILESSSSLEMVSVCDSFLWNEVVYYDSGIFSYATLNSAGCDSIASLDLSISLSSQDTIERNGCQTYEWNGQVYDQSGFYNFAGFTAEGCDSIVVLDLTIQDTVITSMDTEACSFFFWNGQTYNQSGVYDYLTTSVEGCDSTAILNLTIHDTIVESIFISSCEFYIWNDMTFYESGIYDHLDVSQYGCDSTTFLNLEINNTDSIDIEEVACDNYIWNGETYDSSGVYEYQGIGIHGCDSIVFLHLEIQNDFEFFDTIYLCQGDSVFIAEQWVDTDLLLQENFTSVGACDSTFFYEVIVNPSYLLDETITLCPGDSILIDNLWIKDEITIVQEHTSISGCDSIVTINVALYNEDLPMLNDINHAAGDTLDLNLNLFSDLWEVEWSPTELINCNTCTEVSIYSEEDVLIEIIYTSLETGCVYHEEFNIYLIEDGKSRIYVPNIFSPNSPNPDNRNWKVFLGDDDIILDHVSIYDRWGSRVANWEDSQEIIWDGSFNNRPLNQGVYIYLIKWRDVDGKEHILTGNVTLL